MTRAELRRRRNAARTRAVLERVVVAIDRRWIDARNPRPHHPWVMVGVGASLAAHLPLVLLSAPGSAPATPQRLAVQVVRAAPEPDVAEPRSPETAPEPPSEPEPEPEPRRPPRAKELPRRRAAAPSEPEAPPPPPVVGIDLGSTVSHPGGPGFAVGNTTAGRTEALARDPEDIPPLPASANSSVAANRSASRIPGAGAGELIKPRRLQTLQPDYPEGLKKQGVEANVTVSLRLDDRGQVADVELVAPSRYEEFNAAALAAARRERFSPARRGGVAVDYTLTFTYRFRLSDV